MGTTKIAAIRRRFHEELERSIVRWIKKGQRRYPNFADGASMSSVAIAYVLCGLLGFPHSTDKIDSQTVGRHFEEVVYQFLCQAFATLEHLRPGDWEYQTSRCDIAQFVQYRHLEELERLVKQNAELKNALGLDYLVSPDIVVARMPVEDVEINRKGIVVLPDDNRTAASTPLRKANHKNGVHPILHAVISCKWTIRSDRSQNTRTEALSLIRLRKGHMPHIVAVVAEPLPTRIASLAMGTGDLDCVYHIALPELEEACRKCQLDDQLEMLTQLREGNRLRDVSDLPFDLAT